MCLVWVEFRGGGRQAVRLRGWALQLGGLEFVVRGWRRGNSERAPRTRLTAGWWLGAGCGAVARAFSRVGQGSVGWSLRRGSPRYLVSGLRDSAFPPPHCQPQHNIIMLYLQ